MELTDIVRRRRMVHLFEQRPVDPEILDQVFESALHAPSAGFSQGFSMLALTDAGRVRRFWELTYPPEHREALAERIATTPPVLVLTFVNRDVYLERYSRPDKAEAHMQQADAWPVPYWYVDGGMAVMLMLLRAVDLGIDGWFFGIARGEPELRGELGIPADQELIGVLALGHRAAGDRKMGSSVTINRRRLDDVLHREAW